MKKVYSSTMQRFLILCLLLLAGTHLQARGELVWEVLSTPLIGDYDQSGDYTGQEILWLFYNVDNLSTPGDANNLIEFSVSAGTAQGVYNTTAPSGWVVTTQENQIVFSGNGDYIPPSGAAGFTIFSTHTNTAQGAANAV
ncbi:MAG: hypothetical protein EOM10_10290, partial [Opitutae bacterium]|nr:hypothetical protein [Opitutae bacterium]